LDYCFYTHYSKNCFGCIGLRHKQYCIFNKQYSKEEYEQLVPKIIEHMKSTGEFGEFFPAQYSDFAYNETIAQEYFTLNKEGVESRGWRWLEKDKTEYQPATLQVPDNNHDVDNSICGALLACEDCGRNYKIIEQELKFYKNQGVPIPKKCFYCRHKNRFNLRNLRVLYGRKCDLCGVDIQTTYPVSRPEKIYCEKCYQESLT